MHRRTNARLRVDRIPSDARLVPWQMHLATVFSAAAKGENPGPTASSFGSPYPDPSAGLDPIFTADGGFEDYPDGCTAGEWTAGSSGGAERPPPPGTTASSAVSGARSARICVDDGVSTRLGGGDGAARSKQRDGCGCGDMDGNMSMVAPGVEEARDVRGHGVQTELGGGAKLWEGVGGAVEGGSGSMGLRVSSGVGDTHAWDMGAAGEGASDSLGLPRAGPGARLRDLVKPAGNPCVLAGEGGVRESGRGCAASAVDRAGGDARLGSDEKEGAGAKWDVGTEAFGTLGRGGEVPGRGEGSGVPGWGARSDSRTP